MVYIYGSGQAYTHAHANVLMHTYTHRYRAYTSRQQAPAIYVYEEHRCLCSQVRRCT